MLSCTGHDYEWDGESWCYMWSQKEDFDILTRKRRVRCCSCKSLIDIGAECLEFSRYRGPLSDIEERIWGEEVQIASYYMCLSCAEIFLNLEALKYCLDICYNMNNYLIEYWELSGFKKEV